MCQCCFSKVFKILFLVFGFMAPWFTWTLMRQYKEVASSYFTLNLLSPLRSYYQMGPWQNDGEYCYKNDSSVVIFLHVTNSSQWTPIEVCAFKLAAIHNNDTGVCVLSAYQIEPNPVLNAIPNLEIASLDVGKLFNDTPLYDWYEKFILKNKKLSNIWMWELSDALRYVYLYKYGGKYMDTDSWTLRNLGSLRNLAGWQDSSIANGVLFFDSHNPFIEAVITNFTRYFMSGTWGSSGPYLVTSIHNSKRVDNSTYSIVPTHYFYPTHYSQNHYPFVASHTAAVKNLIKNSYAIHLWRYMIRGFYNKPPPNGSYVAEVLSTICSS